MKPHDSPEILDKLETSNISGLPSGNTLMSRVKQNKRQGVRASEKKKSPIDETVELKKKVRVITSMPLQRQEMIVLIKHKQRRHHTHNTVQFSGRNN